MKSLMAKLPKNFAEDVLYLEMELEKPDVDMCDVLRLLEMYRLAIEHFETYQNDMYLVFKSKTQALLSKPNVASCLEKDKENNPRNQQRKQESFDVTLQMARQ
jgi:hypothetical protein